MAGPTTEVLNDDLKDLREDFHKLEVNVRGDIRELSTKVNGIIGAIKLLSLFTLGGLISSVWWGASLAAKVDGPGYQVR